MIDDTLGSIKIEFNFVSDRRSIAFVYKEDAERPTVRESLSLDQESLSRDIMPEGLEYWLSRKIEQVVFSVPDGTCLFQVEHSVKNTVDCVLRCIYNQKSHSTVDVAFKSLFQPNCHRHEWLETLTKKKCQIFCDVMEKLLSSPLNITINLLFYQFRKRPESSSPGHERCMELIGPMIRGVEYKYEGVVSPMCLPETFFTLETLTRLEYINIYSPYKERIICGRSFVDYSTHAKSLKRIKFSNITLVMHGDETLRQNGAFPSLEELEIDNCACVDCREADPLIPLVVQKLVIKGSVKLPEHWDRLPLPSADWFREFCFPRLKHVEYVFYSKCGDESHILFPLLNKMRTLKLLGAPPPPDDRYFFFDLQLCGCKLEELTLSLSGIQSLFDLKDTLTQLPFLKSLAISLYSPTTNSATCWHNTMTRLADHLSEHGALEAIYIEAFGVEICSIHLPSSTLYHI